MGLNIAWVVAQFQKGTVPVVGPRYPLGPMKDGVRSDGYCGVCRRSVRVRLAGPGVPFVLCDVCEERCQAAYIEQCVELMHAHVAERRRREWLKVDALVQQQQAYRKGQGQS